MLTYGSIRRETIGASVIEFRLLNSITDAPIVSLRIEPSPPVIENSNENVTLYCDVNSGNPSTLLKVQWYLNGNLLKELPSCSGLFQKNITISNQFIFAFKIIQNFN